MMHPTRAGPILFAAMAVSLAPAPVRAQVGGGDAVRPTATAHLQGQVSDQVGGRPLSEVAVRLIPAVGDGVLTAMTDNRGRFLLSPIAPGSYVVEFHRLGYASTTDTVRVEPVSDVRMEVSMAPLAMELDGIVVVTTRRSRLESNGFYARQASSGGSFISRQEIDDRRPAYLSDLLRTIPSFRTTQLRDGQGSVVLGRGGCAPIYYLDGIRLVEVQSQDMFIPPGDLEGVEAYTSANAPPQYPGNRCGSIVMWSREPTPTMAYGSFWRRFLVGVGFATGAFLLTR